MSDAPNHPGGGAFIESYIAPDMHMRPLAQTVGHVQAPASRYATSRRCASTTCTRCGVDRHLRRRYDEFVALAGEEIARVWRLYLAGGGWLRAGPHGRGSDSGGQAWGRGSGRHPLEPPLGGNGRKMMCVSSIPESRTVPHVLSVSRAPVA